MDIYAEQVLDHYRHPRGKTSLPHPTVSHTEKNVSCGDSLTIELQIEDDRIAAVGWSGEGCAISQAGMSLLSEILTGMTTLEAAELQPEKIFELLGVPIGPRRMKCALLSLEALQNAVRKK